MARRLAEMRLDPACICQTCLSAVARLAEACDDPEIILRDVRAEVCITLNPTLIA